MLVAALDYLVPLRPSLSSVFDWLQYVKSEGEEKTTVEAGKGLGTNKAEVHLTFTACVKFTTTHFHTSVSVHSFGTYLVIQQELNPCKNWHSLASGIAASTF